MKKYALALALSLIIIPLSALAAEFRAGDIIAVTESVSENIYVAGAQVSVVADIAGDVLAAGGKVLNTGKVDGDVFAAGGNIDILGAVKGDVRAAGGQVVIAGDVSGDLVIAGGVVNILKGTIITGDLVVAGGLVQFDGTVLGETKIYAGQAVVNGELKGDVVISVQENLTFGTEARVTAPLAYSAPVEATLEDGAVLGSVAFTKLEGGASIEELSLIFVGIASLFFLALFVGQALTAALLVKVFPDYTRETTLVTLARWGTTLLWGLGALVLIPVAIVILMISVVGSYLGFALLGIYVFLLTASHVYSAVVAGAVLTRVIVKEARISMWAALYGAVGILVVSLIPIVGWIPVAGIYLISFGALTKSGYEALFGSRA